MTDRDRSGSSSQRMAGSIFRSLKIGVDFHHHLFDDGNEGLPSRGECNGMRIVLKELEADLILKLANPSA
jgi:hypothetical protein